jgi:hypothetical protein
MFAEDVELAESVSIAMLTVLETLAPMERAVFVLHQVFDMPHAEIAPAAGKSKPPAGKGVVLMPDPCPLVGLILGELAENVEKSGMASRARPRRSRYG